jgi:uncharacterized membrane protein
MHFANFYASLIYAEHPKIANSTLKVPQMVANTVAITERRSLIATLLISLFLCLTTVLIVILEKKDKGPNVLHLPLVFVSVMFGAVFTLGLLKVSDLFWFLN